MNRRIRSLGELSALDVHGRVIKYSTDHGKTWTFARLLGDDNSPLALEGDGIVVAHERSNSSRKTILTARDFALGIIVERATPDDARGRKWWS